MRKAIVIGIILSIAVLIAVVVYLFNTKREGFQASDPFKARMDEIKGSDLSTLPYDILTDGGVYMIAGKVKTEVSKTSISGFGSYIHQRKQTKQEDISPITKTKLIYSF